MELPPLPDGMDTYLDAERLEQMTVREAAPYGANDEAVRVLNGHLSVEALREGYYLYHLGIDTGKDAHRFRGVKRVITGGSATRAFNIAKRLHEEFGFPIHRFVPKASLLDGLRSGDLGPFRRRVKSKVQQALGVPPEMAKTERYSMFLVGDTLIVNHGMGIGSVEILLNEVTQLLAAAGAEGVEYFRVGTSGGLGEDPGTVVIADRGWSGSPQVDAALTQHYGGAFTPVVVAGRLEAWPSDANSELNQALVDASAGEGFVIKPGGTMAKDTFNSGEARLDGVFEDLDEKGAMEFFEYVKSLGILNSDMEASIFLAFARRVGIRAAVICVVLDNCMTHESINFTPEEMKEFSRRAEEVLFNYIAAKKGLKRDKSKLSRFKRLAQSLLR